MIQEFLVYVGYLVLRQNTFVHLLIFSQRTYTVGAKIGFQSKHLHFSHVK